MAIWQFALDPVPAGKAEQISHDADRIGAFELSPRERSTLFFRIAAILRPRRAWHRDMRAWGDEQRDDISFFLSGTGVEGMQIRIDVETLSMPFIEAICVLAQDFDWVFAGESGELIQPSPEAVLGAIDQSPAGEYVRDPAAFLARATRDHQQMN